MTSRQETVTHRGARLATRAVDAETNVHWESLEIVVHGAVTVRKMRNVTRRMEHVLAPARPDTRRTLQGPALSLVGTVSSDLTAATSATVPRMQSVIA